jgi:hypothetical protein
MDKYGFFDYAAIDHQNAVVTVLMQSRESLSAGLRRIDHLTEISFEHDFGFALIATMWYDVRNRTDITLLKDALMSILKIVIKAGNPAAEKRRCLDSLSMPLFLGLAPCLDKVTYKRLLGDECHVWSPSRTLYSRRTSDDETASLIDTETIGIHDKRSALLTVGFLASVGENPVLNAQERENVHLLWGMLTNSYPEHLAVGIWYNLQMLPYVKQSVVSFVYILTAPLFQYRDIIPKDGLRILHYSVEGSL